VVGLLGSGCTSGDDGADNEPNPTPSVPAGSTTTVGTTTLDRPDAKLEVSIKQLRGGVERKRWPALQRVIVRPVAAWIDDGYARDRDAEAPPVSRGFRGWTADARELAMRDKSITTNVAIVDAGTAVAVDRREVVLYVFASKGFTGGATAHVNVALTTAAEGGEVKRWRITGRVYLQRFEARWRIFGYDLSRQDV